MREKFGRNLQDRDEVGYDFGQPDFPVESYLRYKGGSCVERFDANSYLYITKAMDYFDPAGDHGSLIDAFKGVRSRFFVISYSGDWLFPTHESKEIVRALQANGVQTTFCEFQSEYGHDAFLLEDEQLSEAIAGFLRNTHQSIGRGRTDAADSPDNAAAEGQR
jgi:homoserine O-acetyltransferase